MHLLKHVCFAGILGWLATTAGCGLLPPVCQDLSVQGICTFRSPDFMDQVVTLNTDAQLQLANPYRHFYVVMRHNEYSDLKARYPKYSLEDYYDFHIENLLQDFAEPQAPGPAERQLQGLEALIGTFTGNYKGDLVYGRLVLLRSKVRLYQFAMWCPVADTAYCRPYMDTIIQTFREIPRER
ncbi:MAG: hypothetical protein SF053_19545 [Bacteroidia bacterium]|nr:hypothetical protein [Bacteroidia bacterium]